MITQVVEGREDKTWPRETTDERRKEAVLHKRNEVDKNGNKDRG